MRLAMAQRVHPNLYGNVRAGPLWLWVFLQEWLRTMYAVYGYYNTLQNTREYSGGRLSCKTYCLCIVELGM